MSSRGSLAIGHDGDDDDNDGDDDMGHRFLGAFQTDNGRMDAAGRLRC
jgi:hypothetical protein